MAVDIRIGDSRQLLRAIPDGSVSCCVTSPPYFGLRDYGMDGQMGLEETPDQYIAGMVELFREVRRALRDDGTLWLNVGDSYAGSRCGPQGRLGEMADRSIASQRTMRAIDGNYIARSGAKPKDLIGIPWMLAFALRADGWYLRQDIIWSKPNPMPESVQDRCTKAHEYLFLLSKGPRYYYDAEAIAEPLGLASIQRLSQNIEAQAGSERVPGKTNGNMKAVGRRAAGNKTHKYTSAYDDGSEVHRTKAGLVGFAERERAKVAAGDLEERRKAIRAAYPFGERQYWPYKGWCKAQREYLRQYDPKTPAPPLVREMLKDKVEAGDICFPFAEEKAHD